MSRLVMNPGRVISYAKAELRDEKSLVPGKWIVWSLVFMLLAIVCVILVALPNVVNTGAFFP